MLWMDQVAVEPVSISEEVRAPETERVPSSEREPPSLPVAKEMTGSSLLPVMVRLTV